MIDVDSTNPKYCREEAIIAKEKVPLKNCTQYVNMKLIEDQLKACKADGSKKSKCHLSFLNEGGDLDIFLPTMPAELEANCYKNSYFYFSAPCFVPKEHIGKRLIGGLILACMGTFVFLYINLYVDYVKNMQENLFIDYDVRTITASDYSVEFKISLNQYEYWKKHFK